jgi:hypothetical protein
MNPDLTGNHAIVKSVSRKFDMRCNNTYPISWNPHLSLEKPSSPTRNTPDPVPTYRANLAQKWNIERYNILGRMQSSRGGCCWMYIGSTRRSKVTQRDRAKMEVQAQLKCMRLIESICERFHMTFPEKALRFWR